jgi:hypothetical protein
MYSSVRVEPLSRNQVSKLLSGQPARVKHNPRGPHTVRVSAEQGKKLAKAAMKGSGVTITFDPYQVDMHRETLGEGINWGKIGKTLKNVFTSDIGKAAQKFVVDKALDVLPLPKGVEDIGRKLAYKGINAQGFEVSQGVPLSLRQSVAKPKRKTKAKRKTGGAMFPAGYAF